MFLDKPEGPKEEMTENKDHSHKIKQESGPEAAVNIGDNAQDDQGDTDI